MKYVIIGNSAAAVGCIEGIREKDKKGSITVVSNEIHHTYSRPLISYLLYGKTDEERMKYRPDSFYEDNGVTTMLGRTAVKINPDKKTVELDDGTVLSYDKLLVATGSKPFIPPMEGLDTVEKSFTFMTLDDAKALDAAITKDSRVLIVGAGLIGLKCAEGIFDKIGHLTVIDLADRILPSILDEKGSELVQKFLEDKGIEFRLGTSAASFDGNKAVLTNGDEIEFDVLVVAVGVRPNTELVSEAGGSVDRGIVTDKYSRTTITDVYAAGDCAKSHDITTGTDRILALLPNAYMQGVAAGRHMTGADMPYENAMPMNAIGFFGYHVITAGNYDGEELVTCDGMNYKKLVVKDNCLKGFIMIGDVRRAGIYTKLIREKVPLDTIDFELISRKPQLMAFSREERAKQLGGKK
ncbi:MAG: FAD-dependent oxidoreductase [Oscillospiraceae bacterium]|nr:FAD-dependent oxidoreductase [Ruminococcus sp.]MDD6097238.1 FAD-dependent oxidoreductase [Oscillospiraceae bacterium]